MVLKWVWVFILLWGDGWGWERGTILFEDSFDGDTLDKRLWEVLEGSGPSYGAGTLQKYLRGGVSVGNGSLRLEARRKRAEFGAEGEEFTSGAVRLKGVGLRGGTVVVRSKMAKGDFLWSSVWVGTRGRRCRYEEIQVGGVNGGRGEGRRVGVSGSWGHSWARMTTEEMEVAVDEDLTEEFHEFGVTWNEEQLTWHLDAKVTFEVPLDDRTFLWSSRNLPCEGSLVPFGEPMSLELSLVVGGPFFGRDSLPLRRDSWTSPVLEVDWVKVYQT